MNRRKKLVTKFNQKDKRANTKLHKSNKPAYASKAERERLALLVEGQLMKRESEHASLVSL
ncbi:MULTISPECIES: DUF2986 domain-containing protein [Pseudoalteromonas]|uniref:DUF2986 domain-containing protein n=1 Tax=Pseudoalteromonas neustonica TaxID=1840331 RepID=A0ABY3FE16_9GAMM|nr:MULTISPECIES: DUF2986 domain-containing protein [Pseudoalteromonas]MBB1294289.1 DUF2986 domain-containing protein [Pseudoalteromonas sp. SR41-4]MBB1311892.1 DUF2986 domain-containing protein [Pseudoalteromonas sp. SR41-8]MBB1411773.1 DUF2986 domain-containing protein [Pseudoalteromonas sp. SG44-17]MBB1508184.1 DUF2986 domain-containing protein [Pseudoalteromonas sp. SG41-1]TVU83615.1 DUF2986 domain-containing protein [Pseudoalteromonas neustonica]